MNAAIEAAASDMEMRENMTDIVERLSFCTIRFAGEDQVEAINRRNQTIVDAAATITTLRAEVAALKHDLDRQMVIANEHVNDNAALREGLREIISRGDHLGAMTAAMADVRNIARALLETNHAVK